MKRRCPQSAARAYVDRAAPGAREPRIRQAREGEEFACPGCDRQLPASVDGLVPRHMREVAA